MRSRAAVFLDRDGTIIAEKAYLADPEGVELVEGAAEAMRRLREAGFALVVVTNQSGIARGLYTLDDYHAVAARLEEVLQARGVGPDATFYCPHHPEASGPCGCRKPATGMHRQAIDELDLDPVRSFFVGDKISDVLPGGVLGGQGILVRTGYGMEHVDDVPEGMWIVDDLPAAVDRILSAEQPAPTVEGAR